MYIALNCSLFYVNIVPFSHRYGILIDPILWIRIFMNQPYSLENLLLLIGKI